MILVTGASGFVGRHAVRALRSRGVEVIALSRTSPTCVENGVVYAPFDLITKGLKGTAVPQAFALSARICWTIR